jgi:hypothetical protein
MEAEAREILTMAVTGSANSAAKGKFDHLVGLWEGRGTTDEMMRELRGED